MHYILAKKLVEYMEKHVNGDHNDEYKKALYAAIAAVKAVMKFW